MTVSSKAWSDCLCPYRLRAQGFLPAREPLRPATPDTDTASQFTDLGLPAARYRAALEQGSHVPAHRYALAAAGPRRIEGVASVARPRTAVAAASRAGQSVPGPAGAGAQRGSSRW